MLIFGGENGSPSRENYKLNLEMKPICLSHMLQAHDLGHNWGNIHKRDGHCNISPLFWVLLLKEKKHLYKPLKDT